MIILNRSAIPGMSSGIGDIGKGLIAAKRISFFWPMGQRVENLPIGEGGRKRLALREKGPGGARKEY